MADHGSEGGFQVRDRRHRGDDTPPAAEARSEPPAAAAEPSPAGAPPSGERSLVGLFVMLASFAAAALEGVPDPGTGRVEQDPQQAAEIVDLLMLLREKTEGRRSPEESQTLDALIYDLQVRYVRATTGSR